MVIKRKYLTVVELKEIQISYNRKEMSYSEASLYIIDTIRLRYGNVQIYKPFRFLERETCNPNETGIIIGMINI